MATQTTQTQTVLPEWYEQYAKTLLGKAYGATSQPYQTYGAARVAGFTPEQNQAFGMVNSNVGNWKPAVNAAMGAANAGTANWTDPGVAGKYMSPYTDAVVDDIGVMAGRNLSENLLPAVNRTFVGGGTFGGSRSEEFTARAVRDANEAALRQQNAAREAGYNIAGNLFNQDAGRDLQGGQLLNTIGTNRQALAGRDAAAVEAVGAQKQALQQKSADLAYQDFERQRDYPLLQAQQLAGIGGAPGAGGTGSSTVTAPGPNNTASTIGNIIGGIGTIGSLFSKKNGGVIRRYGIAA